ncbi:hypothetical protein [Falsibacillus pallidus]|uniref:hypothetical protein n=1 Tax=Falsibacillus pallidus TaxID=493781 RepID=UPI003D96D2CC
MAIFYDRIQRCKDVGKLEIEAAIILKIMQAEPCGGNDFFMHLGYLYIIHLRIVELNKQNSPDQK